jgi:hypothetical protein
MLRFLLVALAACSKVPIGATDADTDLESDTDIDADIDADADADSDADTDSDTDTDTDSDADTGTDSDTDTDTDTDVCTVEYRVAAVRFDGTECAPGVCTEADELGWMLEARNPCPFDIVLPMTCSSLVFDGTLSGTGTSRTSAGGGASGGPVTYTIEVGSAYSEAAVPEFGLLGADTYTLSVTLCDLAPTTVVGTFEVRPF